MKQAIKSLLFFLVFLTTQHIHAREDISVYEGKLSCKSRAHRKCNKNSTFFLTTEKTTFQLVLPKHLIGVALHLYYQSTEKNIEVRGVLRHQKEDSKKIARVKVKNLSLAL